MTSMQGSNPTSDASNSAPLWKRCLDFDSQDGGHYNNYVHTPLFDLLDGTPTRVLDLGCAAGAFGAELMRRFPEASVVGIEAGRAAAEMAKTRLERVVHARLEELSFADQGFRPGEFDTVIAGDILEHLVNPWELLVRLRPFLAPKAQIVASIPNIRNITVVSSLLQGGRFEYDERGLLDITHLRFFTLESIKRLFEETGYVLERHVAKILPSLERVYRTYQGRGPALLKIGRMTLSDMTQQELTELCAVQFLTRSRAP